MIYLAGKSCPRPGDIQHGQWTCEEQQIPIPETAGIGGELETYPGKKNLNQIHECQFPQHCNVDLIVILDMRPKFRLSSLVWMETMTHSWKKSGLIRDFSQNYVTAVNAFIEIGELI